MRYLVYGYYGFGNFGDDLMLAAITSAIRTRDPGAEIVVKCREAVPGMGAGVSFLDVERIMETPGRPALLRAASYLWRLMRVVKDRDWLVIGGGALFLDKGGVNKSLLLLWLLVLRARLAGVRVAVIGVSFDLLANPVSLWLTRGIFRRADAIVVRDVFSYDYARYFGRGDAVLCPDLAFAAPGVAFPARTRVVSSRPVLAVCLIDYFATYEADPVRRAGFLAAFRTLLDRYAGAVDFVYVALQEGLGLSDDALYRDLGGADRFSRYQVITSAEECIALLGQIDGICSMRYHLALLAAAAGVAATVFYHELKMAAVGLLPGVQVIDMAAFAAGQADPLAPLLDGGVVPRQPDVPLSAQMGAAFDWVR